MICANHRHTCSHQSDDHQKDRREPGACNEGGGKLKHHAAIIRTSADNLQ